MKTKFVAATVIALAAMSGVSAFADTSDFTPAVAATPSTLTRAEVMAEYYKARQEGALQVITESGNPIVAQAPAASTVTREEVRKEAIQAARTNAFHGVVLQAGCA
jgi:hypothetical protein